MTRYKTLGAAGVSCLLALAVLCLATSSVPAAPLPAGGPMARSAQHRNASRAHQPQTPSGRSVWADQPTVAGDSHEQGLDAGSYLPLVIKDYYFLPPWSGYARFGFGVSDNPVEDYNVSLLHADWYLSFRFRPDPPPLSDLEFVQTIRLSGSGYWPNQEAIVEYATHHRGTLWLVGNEPDAPYQDCVTPWQYAWLYHQLHGIIKGADPSAKVAIGGVVQATPLRLQYLDTILQAYQNAYGEMIPVDVWNVHGFILREKANDWGCQIPCGLSAQQGMLYTIDQHDNMTIFREQIVRFRQWMKDRGQRNKPLIVSEYGILMPAAYGFDEPRVESFMLATFDYLSTAASGTLGYPNDGNRLVQAWCWYSLDDDSFEGYDSYSHLFDPDTKQITPLGIAYANYAASSP